MKLEFVDTTSPVMINYIHTKGESGKAAIFRFYGILSYGIPLDNLMPREPVLEHLRKALNYPDLEDQESYTFDMMYAEQLLNDKASFFDLMKIMSALQTNGGSDEVIVTSNYTHPVVMPIVDSLIKFIQERYGIRSYITNYPEDIDPYSVSEFSDMEHYMLYLKDIEWYENMRKRLGNAI